MHNDEVNRSLRALASKCDTDGASALSRIARHAILMNRSQRAGCRKKFNALAGPER